LGEETGRKETTWGRNRRRWEDNIKMYLYEIDCEDVDWYDRAQNWDRWWAVVNAVMNFRIS
jgi:hypothetical protein